MKKIIFATSLLLIFLITVGFLFAEKEKKVTIAACPTLHYLLEALKDNDKAYTVKSGSTEESLKMIGNGSGVFLIIRTQSITANGMET